MVPTFAGGSGIIGYSIQSVATLFDSSVNVNKMAVFLTDGEQMVKDLESCTYELSQQLQQDGVEIFAVGEFFVQNLPLLNAVISLRCIIVMPLHYSFQKHAHLEKHVIVFPATYPAQLLDVKQVLIALDNVE